MYNYYKVYIPTYLHTYMHSYIHSYIHIYIHTYTHAHTTYVCTYIHTYIHTNIMLISVILLITSNGDVLLSLSQDSSLKTSDEDFFFTEEKLYCTRNEDTSVLYEQLAQKKYTEILC